MKEEYIRFTADVNDQTMGQLCSLIENAVNNNSDRIHLMISSSGGNIYSGVTAYNILKKCPVELYTYNMGYVESIAMVLFCLGKKRFSCEQARFLVHESEWNFNNENIGITQMEKRLENLKTHQDIIVDILSKTTKKSHDFYNKMYKDLTILTPQMAMDYGIATDMATEPIMPMGSKILAITNVPVQPQPQAGNNVRACNPIKCELLLQQHVNQTSHRIEVGYAPNYSNIRF